MTPSLPSAASPIIHYGTTNKPPIPQRPFSDPNLLSPEAAFYAHSPPHSRQQRNDSYAEENDDAVGLEIPSLRGGGSARRRRGKDRGRSGSRKGKGVWKKLLWVKQREYPDNYTDPPTFLSHLQRNPRLRPYDFWPLVADSTVIVQHISSVAIFVCSFVGIYQRRVSPVSVVGWGSAGTVLGWVLWDMWIGQEETSSKPLPDTTALGNNASDFIAGSVVSSASTPTTPSTQSTEPPSIGLGLTLPNTNSSPRKGHHTPTPSQTSTSSAPSPSLSRHPSISSLPPSSSHPRLATAKSAILIYTALLGLSPILKSLTESTSSDSIWAISCWLILLNIFFFDYSGGIGAVKFPASLSTNAALMASTVLASRLPSTTHVFSLTLFSIEVFGLFPVFRRHLRHISWRGHLVLTLALMVGAGAGLGLVISRRPLWSGGGWKSAVAGAVVWAVGSAVGMGGCSWWLIGLQRYKNVVIGPWDPARPVIRGGAGWD